MQPKVSVIIPVYNVEKYLRECLDSVVNQTLKKIEIICVDDGSTDNSGKILDEYAVKDDRIKVIHKENGGYGKAMNVGLDNATGEYIGIVEPDDYIELNMYEEFYKKSSENDLDFVKGNFYKYSTITETKNELCVPFNKTRVYNKIIKPIDFIETFNGNICIWAAIYNNKFLKDNSIRFLETPGASFQDTSFWIKVLFSAERGMFIDKAYNHYRIDNENSSVKQNNKIFCICDEMHELENVYKNDIEKIRIINALKIDKYTWNYNRLDTKAQKQFFKIYYKELYPIMCKKYYKENFIPKSIINNCRDILIHFNREYIKNKTDILIIEYNDCHGECLPGYINYFLELGYKVDVIISDKLALENPLNMFIDNPNVFIDTLNADEIIEKLDSVSVNKYKYCFLNSEIVYSKNKVIFDLIEVNNYKTKFVCVCHRQENLKKLERVSQPVILKSFKKCHNEYTVNPHYFGNIEKHRKNKLINFIVAGNVENKRKNYNLLVSTVEKLLNNNIRNFKVTVIGRGKDLYLPEHIKPFFDIKGRLSYFSMYEEIKNADFFLTLLDPDNEAHSRYLTRGTSGSFQLINGFLIPAIIENSFAEVHDYNTTNAILYESNDNLYEAMKYAINMDELSYISLQKNLEHLSEKINNKSLINLQKMLKHFSLKRYIYINLKNIFSVKNRNGRKVFTILGIKIKISKRNIENIFSVRNEDIRKVITILGIKFKFKSKKLIERKRLVNLENVIYQINSDLQNKKNNITNLINKIDKQENNFASLINKIEEQENNFASLINKINEQGNSIEIFRKQINEQINNVSNDLKKQSNEILYAEVLKNCTENSNWLKKQDFTLTLGAANYSFIFILFKILDEIKPKTILEMGLGQTTKLTTQYTNFYKNSFLDVIEHNQKWIDIFSQKLDLSENICIYHKSLINFTLSGIESDKYDSLEDVAQSKKYDLIIIDGPFGFDRIYPRTNVLDLIPNNLAENFIIVLDDAERRGEKNTANLIFQKLDENNIKFKKSYKVGLKTQLVITSPDYEYIHWF